MIVTRKCIPNSSLFSIVLSNKCALIYKIFCFIVIYIILQKLREFLGYSFLKCRRVEPICQMTIPSKDLDDMLINTSNGCCVVLSCWHLGQVSLLQIFLFVQIFRILQTCLIKPFQLCSYVVSDVETLIQIFQSLGCFLKSIFFTV